MSRRPGEAQPYRAIFGETSPNVAFNQHCRQRIDQRDESHGRNERHSLRSTGPVRDSNEEQRCSHRDDPCCRRSYPAASQKCAARPDDEEAGQIDPWGCEQSDQEDSGAQHDAQPPESLDAPTWDERAFIAPGSPQDGHVPERTPSCTSFRLLGES